MKEIQLNAEQVAGIVGIASRLTTLTTDLNNTLETQRLMFVMLGVDVNNVRGLDKSRMVLIVSEPEPESPEPETLT